MWFGSSCWLLLEYCIFDALQYPELGMNFEFGLQPFSVRKWFKGRHNPALQPLSLEHDDRDDVHEIYRNLLLGRGPRRRGGKAG